MATFSRTRRDTADVPHPVQAVWDLLIDPDAVARMTPLVSSIDVDDEGRWIWHLQRVPLPGRRLDLVMTEEMTFTPTSRIDFAHPPLREGLQAGATGHYGLEPLSEDSTRLSIELTITAQLPVPGAARRAVEPTMQQVLHQMGTRFAHHMEDELRKRR